MYSVGRVPALHAQSSGLRHFKDLGSPTTGDIETEGSRRALSQPELHEILCSKGKKEGEWVPNSQLTKITNEVQLGRGGGVSTVSIQRILLHK